MGKFHMGHSKQPNKNKNIKNQTTNQPNQETTYNSYPNPNPTNN